MADNLPDNTISEIMEQADEKDIEVLGLLSENGIQVEEAV